MWRLGRIVRPTKKLCQAQFTKLLVLSFVNSESDAEQKAILPLLTSGFPNGLAYDLDDIYTKNSVRNHDVSNTQFESNHTEE